MKAKITDRRIWVSLERTVQLNPYEPAKVVVGMSGDIPDGNDECDYYDEMFDMLSGQLLKGLVELKLN